MYSYLDPFNFTFINLGRFLLTILSSNSSACILNAWLIFLLLSFFFLASWALPALPLPGKLHTLTSLLNRLRLPQREGGSAADAKLSRDRERESLSSQYVSACMAFPPFPWGIVIFSHRMTLCVVISQLEACFILSHDMLCVTGWYKK